MFLSIRVCFSSCPSASCNIFCGLVRSAQSCHAHSTPSFLLRSPSVGKTRSVLCSVASCVSMSMFSGLFRSSQAHACRRNVYSVFLLKRRVGFSNGSLSVKHRECYSAKQRSSPEKHRVPRDGSSSCHSLGIWSIFFTSLRNSKCKVFPDPSNT